MGFKLRVETTRFLDVLDVDMRDNCLKYLLDF
jgi:hypothetical protein